MLTILIIANEPRAISLKEQFQPLLKAQISVVDDYEHGLKEVFDKRPAAVFIQQEIGGVPGATVAKQIKGLLRDASPRLVLLGDARPMEKEATPFYDDGISFTVPQPELFELFKGQLEKLPYLLWQEKGAEPRRPALAEPAKLAVASPAEPLPGKPAGPLPPLAPPRPPPAPAPVQTEPLEVEEEELPPFDSIFLESGVRHRRPWLYIAGFFVTAALCAWIYLWYMPGGTPKAHKSSVAPAPSAVQAPVPAAVPQPSVQKARISGLPAIIPTKNRDSLYSTTHPGWERYLAEGTEFLVYRASNEIKAIQVVAARNGVITDGIINELLRELWGISGYSVSAGSEKQGYLIQQARLPGDAELVIYRRKTDSQIRGIVVTVP